MILPLKPIAHTVVENRSNDGESIETDIFEFSSILYCKILPNRFSIKLKLTAIISSTKTVAVYSSKQ